MLDDFARIIAESERLVVLTGAGISRESGIPTFREALDGLWAQYDPTKLATPQAFAANPKLVWDFYTYRREKLSKAQPNAAHYALVELEKLLPQLVIVTQNVDGFHQQVGSSDVICLHGNIQLNKCHNDCRGRSTLVDVSKLEWDRDSGPPICPYCNEAYVRPDVVWFNEELPPGALLRAYQLSLAADVMLVVGTSGVVMPAAQLPWEAYREKAIVLEINPNESGISAIAKYRLASPAAEIIPQVVDKVRECVG